ncbi:hypothetical protein [Blastopirellula marina]|uniref:Uncharacterized protein n=1 Tax=Blastopirellula marina DSM 3645 TaxID=314230 RepID=A3ZQ74_9BACT|nr:hypothetical protein [Blastopirellula marina]EAQ81347.1 hypothetical protein DSM3645_23186 [Blastopirellula marina DSM 3645]
MTSQLLRKPRTTARTFIKTTTRALCGAVILFSAADLWAADGQPQSHLQWRRSTKVSTAPEVATPAGVNAPVELKPVHKTSSVQPVAHVELAPPAGQRMVQTASKLSPADPFNDPFGDQLTQLDQEEVAPATPPSRFGAPQPLAPSNDVEPPLPMTNPPMNAPKVPSPMPSSSDREPMELGPDGLPIQPRQPQSAPCNTVYNDRNCCDDKDNCNAIVDRLKAFKLPMINLDMTPAFRPDEEDAELAEQMKNEAMAEAPSRSWTSLNGELLAEGRMLDFKNQRVLIDTGREIKRFDLRTLSADDRCFVAAYWDLPYECGWTDAAFPGRHWATTEVNWTASALCHKPLYFEERALERYGHMTGPITQPLLSGAHFFVSAAVLPYQMGMYPPSECQYALGYYRPGSCAPYLLPPVPISLRGAAAQAAVVTGAVYWIP